MTIHIVNELNSKHSFDEFGDAALAFLPPLREGRHAVCKTVGVALCALMPALVALPAPAVEGYPEKPIHLLVPFPPGSPPDIFARILGDTLAGALGKPAIVENVPGAGGSIAAERLARAAPDGYTAAVLTEAQIVVNPAIYHLAYDPLKDLAPVAPLFAGGDLLVVNTEVPARSLRELIALAKAKPGALTYASGGSGTTSHLAAELFKSAAGVEIRHVPYKGILAAVPDLLAGRVTLVFSPVSIVLPMVREGKLRALAVTSRGRSPAAPDVPTLAEAGCPGVEMEGWNGLFVPARTPEPIIRELRQQAVDALKRPEFRSRLGDLGLEPIPGSPEQFRARIDADAERWRRAVANAGIEAH